MTNKEIEKIEVKHYPISWQVVDNKIEVWDINGKDLAENHFIYKHELDFIQQEIKDKGRFSGEIHCI